MLKHELHETDAALTAAEVRVGAKELADAVAALQARKEEAARRVEGTIPIQEAIDELHLDATPEEILAEVRAQRGARANGQHRLRRRLAPLLGVGVVLIGWAIHEARTGPAEPPGTTATIAVTSPTITPLPAVPLTIAPDARLQVQTASGPSLWTLAEIPDDRPFRARLRDDRSGFDSFLISPGDWTLVKHNGRLYVRGWIDAMSPRALEQTAVEIRNNGTYVAGQQKVIHVTLALDNFRSQTGTSFPSGSAIQATGVRLDRHAWEKW